MMKDIFFEDVGGPVTSLAVNKIASQVAVAGRSIFKIYSIGEAKFLQTTNLRAVKNPHASCNDIAWNQIDENVLASATPSGVICTWNLGKQGYSKMDNVYHDHKRPVNKIHFHSNDPHLLLSGSQDSVKLFDLRQNEAVISYTGFSESIRDLQFSPHKSNIFIAVQDNGYIQQFDIRKKDKSEQSFPGHNGPIFACDWHPEQSDIAATAGRDMSIKVWCLVTQTPIMQHCIPTMESVSKIRWSYEDRNQIASCSLKRDYSVNIWDIHRPYIALARFTEPQEITTGIYWRKNASSLITVTNNGTLYQLPMSDAYRPLEHTNPVGMAINPDGDIALALGDGLLKSNHQTQAQLSQSILQESSSTTTSTTTGQSTTSSSPSNQTSTAVAAASSTVLSSSTPLQNSLPSRLGGVHHHPSGGLGPFLQSHTRTSATRRSQDSALRVSRISSRSQLDVYKCTEMNWFVTTAQEYKLSNRPLAELCDHNAEVCARLKRFQICQTWKILKLFYANIPSQTNLNTSNSNSQYQQARHTSSHLNQDSNSRGFRPHSVIGGDETSLSGQIRADSEFSYTSLNRAVGHRQQHSFNKTDFDNNSAITQTNKSLDALDRIDNESFIDYEQSVNGDGESTDDWLSHENISYEAFQPKQDIFNRVEKLMDLRGKGNDGTGGDNYALSIGSSSSTSTGRGDGIVLNEQEEFEDDGDNQALPYASRNYSNQLNYLRLFSNLTENENFKLTHSYNTKAYQFKFYEIIADVIADVLKYHVDNSDVQSAVSILIVLGDRIKNIVDDRIPEVDRESWYYSYIDLLSKFQLWNVMAQVINLSPLQNTNSINQTSTTIYTTCGSCDRPLNGAVSWICERCKTQPSECSVCHGVVVGLMSWCQGCYHGGHLIHMSQWFSENEYCPTGCGHLCELSQWR